MVDPKHSELEDIDRLNRRMRDTLDEIEALVSSAAYIEFSGATARVLVELAQRKSQLELAGET